MQLGAPRTYAWMVSAYKLLRWKCLSQQKQVAEDRPVSYADSPLRFAVRTLISL